MLSILIPTYNFDITALVKSVSKQLDNVNFAYEILVADDNSSNQEISIKNKSIENIPHCTLFIQAENKGRTFNRNFLATQSKYDFLLFMDADVLPQGERFIANFDVPNNTMDVVFGGIAYSPDLPEASQILRWKYGKAREAKTVSEREKVPYLSIISQCFLIKKEVFFKANNYLENAYGVDVLFAENLEQMKATVKHIENPIIHYGLESNESFITKTKKGLDTLAWFTKEQKIAANYRPIQKAYMRLKKYHLTSVFLFFSKLFNTNIEKNLRSANPSLFLFDMYRLAYYTQINSKNNA